jgi:hypothetical protein
MQGDGDCCTTVPEGAGTVDRREGDQAGNLRKSKQRGRGRHGNEWTTIVINVIVQVPFGKDHLAVTSLCKPYSGDEIDVQ